MKDLSISYGLCLLGFFGLAGLHRFYLNKPISGVLYLITGGFFGIGTIFDLLCMPSLVDSYNYGVLTSQLNHLKRFTNPERNILLIASKNDGIITPQMVTMGTNLGLRQARQELEKMRKESFCTLDIAEDGAELYRFHGLQPKKPLL